MKYLSEERLKRWKLSIDVATPIAVVAIAVLIATNLTQLTKAFEDKLEKAGLHLTEIDLPGMKAEVASAQTRVQAIQGTVGEATNTVNQISNDLKCTPHCSDEQIKIAQANLSGVSASLNSALAQTQPVASQLNQVSVAASPAPSPLTAHWVAVVSADQDEQGAKDEVNHDKNAKYPDVEYVKRNNWWRTVIHFNSQDEANNALPDIQAMTHRTPYLRDFLTWCPNPTTDEHGHKICGATPGA